MVSELLVRWGGTDCLVEPSALPHTRVIKRILTQMKAGMHPGLTYLLGIGLIRSFFIFNRVGSHLFMCCISSCSDRSNSTGVYDIIVEAI
jgi:hypothetical protein